VAIVIAKFAGKSWSKRHSGAVSATVSHLDSVNFALDL